MLSKKLLRYILMNTFFSACIYFGFYQNVDAAKTMALIIAWFCIILSILIFLVGHDKVVEKIAQEPPTLNRNIDLLFDMLVVIAFAAATAWVTAGFYLIHVFLMMTVGDKVDKIRADNKKIKDATVEPQEKNMNFFHPK